MTWWYWLILNDPSNDLRAELGAYILSDWLYGTTSAIR